MSNIDSIVSFFTDNPLTRLYSSWSQPTTLIPSPVIADQLSSAAVEAVPEFMPAKPVLEPPVYTRSERMVEYSLLQFLDKMDGVGHSLRLVNIESLEECHKQMLEIQAQHIQKMNEAALRSQQESTWSLLKKIGSIILASISTVLGISLVATAAGSVLGGLMIASGILTLVNLAFSETHVWDWVAEKLAKDNVDRQKLISTLLPAAVGGLCAIAGLAGSTGVALWAGLNFSQKLLVIGQVAISFLEGGFAIGEGVCQYREHNSKAGLLEIKQKQFNNSREIEKHTSAMEKFMRSQSEILEHIKKELKLTIQVNTKTIIQG